MELLEVNKKAFNSRRVLLVQDPFEKKIWIYKGKSSAKTTRNMGEIKAKELNGKLGFQFIIETVDLTDSKIIDHFLEKAKRKPNIKIEDFKVKKSNGKKIKASEKKQKLVIRNPSGIPKAVAPTKGKGENPVPKGDLEKEGPMIEEFQIAFADSEKAPDFGGVIGFIQVLDRLIKSGASRDLAEKEMKKALHALLNSYFE